MVAPAAGEMKRMKRQRGFIYCGNGQQLQAASAAQPMRARAARIRRLSAGAPRDTQSLLSLFISFTATWDLADSSPTVILALKTSAAVDDLPGDLVFLINEQCA